MPIPVARPGKLPECVVGTPAFMSSYQEDLGVPAKHAPITPRAFVICILLVSTIVTIDESTRVHHFSELSERVCQTRRQAWI